MLSLLTKKNIMIKFIVSSSYLSKQLQILGSVINSTPMMPILDNFLFELNDNALKVTASDLETSITGVLEVESEGKANVAIPSKKLLDILKSLPEQPVTFILDDNNMVDLSTDNGKYSIPYYPGEEFPKPMALENPNATQVTSEVLSSAINKTIFATGNDDLRPVMSGVFFQFSSEKLIFVATDAHKLVKYSREDFTSNEVVEFIMPKKPLNVLRNVLSSLDAEVKIEYNDSNATFSFESYVLTCRLIDGKYPNYEAVIPKENPNKLQINRELFLNSVRRVSIFANKTTHQIRIKLAGTELQISAEDVDFSNKGSERLTCEYHGDDMQIGYNAKFLIEMLSNLSSDDIMIEMSLPNRAGILTPLDGLIEGEKITMLVMPVMLND